MHKKTFLACLAVGTVVALLPIESLAQTTNDFASQDFMDQSDKIQQFLFGPAMRIAAVVGGGYGLIKAIIGSSLKPLVVYGGIGLSVGLLPKFIDGVFNVSGMLIP
ncbi:MAG: hypothetical protein S4CHLAM123_10670 [Chlamydiales bacterium]|nr:hypothetical protein [Chlamydiales bacterium]